MDDALRVVVEMNETIWGRFKSALEDLSEEEIHWRFLPQANTINVIVRQKHMATHLGQIRTIRNLYRKTRGEPARFFPENPTYPN